MVQLLWKTVWWFPTKLHVHLSCDSKLSCQSTYLKEVKAETPAPTTMEFPEESEFTPESEGPNLAAPEMVEYEDEYYMEIIFCCMILFFFLVQDQIFSYCC